MFSHFINPNWHVVLIHLPLGILTTGVIIELITILYRKSWIQNAGRLMILIGAMGSVIAAAAGVYAFRNVVADVPTIPQMKLATLVEQSTWSQIQWQLMSNHLLFNLTAIICFSLVVMIWLASTERWRNKLYWPLLIILLLGTALMTSGARYGGDAVYLHGTAINPAVLHQQDSSLQHYGIEQEQGIEYFIPPLQLHVVLAGIIIALLMVAAASSINYAIVAYKGSLEPISSKFVLFIWFSIFIFALANVFAGLWSAIGGFGIHSSRINFQMLSSPEHKRLLVHLIAAATFILFVFITVAAMRYSRKKISPFVLIAVNVLLACGIIGTGVLMLFDSHDGPLLKFTPPHSEHQQIDHQHSH
ncbi:MAG: hypothetical protein A2Y12_16550 [Planctomycetes bacterium GWF2_42_9]|nr:MAG: hypothetical protein A2Y12_16550 [Planctomycetes bacterium GWF2_42_9]